MELRKDPITQSWVIQEDGQGEWPDASGCPLCPGQESLFGRAIYEHPYGHTPWQVRVVPHPRPLYRIEGDAQRRAEGMYDKMRNLGAHEILIEHPDHRLQLSQQTDENFAQVLRAFVARISDLKKDRRFRYVSVFRNQGPLAGQDLEHPHSQIAATPFIPRRVIYELRSAQRHFGIKERCLYCDILKQELSLQQRVVDCDDMFAAFCPFASRMPYEIWVMPTQHHCSFEEDLGSWDRQFRLARFLKGVLRRLETIAPTHQVVLHSSPNVHAKLDRQGHWQTLGEDFHWHLEILPVLRATSKSYSIKEVYYNSLSPEVAAKDLRGIDPNGK